MALEGNLRTLSFADVLQLLGSTNKTGVLHLRRGAAWKKLYLRDGTVLAASSSDAEEFVGPILVAMGKLSEADLSRALARQQREGKLLGRLLLDDGLIDETVLHRYLCDCAFAMVAKLMNWSDAQFRFEEYALPSHDLVSLDLKVEALLMEGIRRADDIGRFRELLPGDDVLVERGDATPDRELLDQTMVARVYATLADGPRTLRDLRKELKASEFVLLDGVTRLIERGMVRPHGRPPSHQPPEQEWLEDSRRMMLAALTEDAVRALRAGLEHEPHNGPARALLAEAESRLVRELTRSEFPFAAVPRLMVDIDQLVERSLSPTEAFLLSRIDGRVDIETILEATPLPGSEVLLSLRRLIVAGFISIHQGSG